MKSEGMETLPNNSNSQQLQKLCCHRLAGVTTERTRRHMARPGEASVVGEISASQLQAGITVWDRVRVY